MQQDCLFCQVINGTILSKKIYENEFVYAFLDIFPNSDGHILVIPKIHCEYYSDTPDEYLSAVVIAGKLIVQKIYQELKPIGINYISNEKAPAYQQIFHFHLHIIPKYNINEGFGFKININKKNLHDLDEIQTLLTLS